jgi:hypothetical protein
MIAEPKAAIGCGDTIEPRVNLELLSRWAADGVHYGGVVLTKWLTPSERAEMRISGDPVLLERARGESIVFRWEVRDCRPFSTLEALDGAWLMVRTKEHVVSHVWGDAGRCSQGFQLGHRLLEDVHAISPELRRLPINTNNHIEWMMDIVHNLGRSWTIPMSTLAVMILDEEIKRARAALTVLEAMGARARR